jgi:DegV family protein with EDD domain
MCLTVGSRLSATHASATAAREALPDAPIRIVDSGTASWSIALLALLAAEVAATGADLETVAEATGEAAARSRLYVALDTLEYLRRGGRISAAQAAIGSVLSVKPIITIEKGVVETVDRPRTRSRARARTLELLEGVPLERLVVLHTMTQDVEAYADLVADRTGLDRGAIDIRLVGPTVAPHVGPGACGVAFIAARP